ncbi:MAG: hypothetical protein ACK42H_19470 [Planctomycetota bacterium]|jgi:hypothetical protein
MNLTTVTGVTEAITKLLSEKPKDKPSPQMLAALDAVVGLVEKKYSNNASVTDAMQKVRTTFNLKPEADSLNGG